MSARCECGHPMRGSHYTTSDFARRCLYCECIVPPALQRCHQVSVLPTPGELRERYPMSSSEPVIAGGD